LFLIIVILAGIQFTAVVMHVKPMCAGSRLQHWSRKPDVTVDCMLWSYHSLIHCECCLLSLL